MKARRSEHGVLGQRLFSRLSALQDEVYGKNRMDKNPLTPNAYRPLQPVRTPFHVKAPKPKAKAASTPASSGRVVIPSKPSAVPSGVPPVAVCVPDKGPRSSSVPRLGQDAAPAKIRSVVKVPAKAPTVRRNLRPSVGSVWGVRERRNQS